MKQFKRCVMALVGMLLALAVPASASQAQTVGPVMTGIPTNSLVCLKPSLPFVWLRDKSSSYSVVRLTLFPADYARLVRAGAETFDGTQWWLYVYAFPNFGLIRGGYVEENSFDSSHNYDCQPPLVGVNVPLRPQLAGTLCIKPGIPFIWERRAPSSYAPISTVSLNDGTCMSKPFPPLSATDTYYWDGVQWWIKVGHAPRVFSSAAWVETNSLQSGSAIVAN